MIRKGFTLIELLVVIAIIALLLSIVMPGLNMAKKKAASAACLSNAKQMSLAWYMYQGESDGEIVAALMENVGVNTECREGWIGQPHLATDATSSSLSMTQTSPVTDEDESRGAEKGKLYPYLENPDVFHCPADKLRKGPDGTRLYVSYALPTCLNGASGDTQIKKYGDITSPGTRFTFVESGERERGNWIAQGHFIMATPEYGHGGYGLWSPLAISHGDSAVFGFADGHAEVHKWHDQQIFEHYMRTEGAGAGATYDTLMIAPGVSEDFDWLVKGWAYRYKR